MISNWLIRSQALKIKKTVECNLTGEQWGLYAASMNCAEAARALNRAFESAVNSGLCYGDVQNKVDIVRREYRKFGANDTEPREVLAELLEAVFGD